MIKIRAATFTAATWLLSIINLVHGWTTRLPTYAAATRRGSNSIGKLYVASATQPQEDAKSLDDDDNCSKNSKQQLPKQQEAHKRIYSMPALYDIAFGYRDYEEEVEFLLQNHEQLAGFAARRILDVAAGPARHGITALQMEQDLSITCVDLSPEMAQYAQELAIDELSDERRSNFQYITDDIRTMERIFEDGEAASDNGVEQDNDTIAGGSSNLFDSAWILLGSLQHLTRNDEVVQCFSRIHDCLRPGGTVIVELPHPRETFSMIDCTRNYWNVPLEDEDEADSGELQIVWGDEDDEFDPITQVRQLTIEMKLTNMPETEEMQSVRGIVPTRLFTAQELNAMAALAGFRIPAMFGALEHGVSVNDEDAAFRMVCVLQKQ